MWQKTGVNLPSDRTHAMPQPASLGTRCKDGARKITHPSARILTQRRLQPNVCILAAEQQAGRERVVAKERAQALVRSHRLQGTRGHGMIWEEWWGVA